MRSRSHAGVVLFLSSFVTITSPLSAQQDTSRTQSLPEQITVQQKPPDEPAIIEDGGFSVQLQYWFTRAQPTLRGGASFTGTAPSDFDFAGNAKNTPGITISIPAGKQNSLRISYFRTQGHGDSPAASDLSLFGTSYAAGDFLNASYRLQNVKLSWDYLSYTFYKPKSKIRFKTLWEVQYTTIYSTIDAPLKAVATDSSGNPISNTASETKTVVFPTFGGEFEQVLNKRLRWEAKASGFGIPHHAVIWDTEATVYFPVKTSFEVLAGAKAYHFKTSPKDDQYLFDTLSGAYVGLRYYWGRTE